MKQSRVVRILVAGAICALLALAPALAEDTKGKWQLGFGLSYYSTIDYIRSNADVAIASGVAGEDGLPSVTFVDPRPDSNVLNRPGVQDDFKLDFSASYGLTRWFAMEVSASYLKAPVGNIEVFVEDINKDVGDGSFGSTDPLDRTCGPQANLPCYAYNASNVATRGTNNGFLPVGEITEIPIQLSGLVRFRPESPFDPYVGLGIGYIMTDLKTDDRFDQEAELVSTLSVQTPILGNAVEDPAFQLQEPGTPGPLTAEVNNAFEWHAIGGVDYYLSERFSMFVDARYVWTSGAVDVQIWDAQQGILPAIQLGKLRDIQKGALEDLNGDGVSGGYDVEGNPDDRASYYWLDHPDTGRFPDGCTEPGGPGCVLWEELNVSGNDAVALWHNTFYALCEQSGLDCRNGLYETDDKNGNGLYEQDWDPDTPGAQPEDDGWLYQLPPGSADVEERIRDDQGNDAIYCSACAGRGAGPRYGTSQSAFLPSNSEDLNYTRSLDRYLRFGVDCSTVDAAAFPECAGVARVGTIEHYVWPSECPTTAPNLPLSEASRALGEGCPRPRGRPQSSTGIDNVTDTYLIQGGSIHLGGFSLGVGMKFTF